MIRSSRKKTGKKRANPEHKIQVALFDYLKLALRPELEARAIPNGGFRHWSVAQGLQNEGVKSGTPDIFICLPKGRVAWLEMKAPKGVLSPEQEKFRDRVIALGHFWALAKSVDEALMHLTEWDALKPAFRRSSTFFPTNHLASISLAKPTKGSQSHENH